MFLRNGLLVRFNRFVRLNRFRPRQNESSFAEALSVDLELSLVKNVFAVCLAFLAGACVSPISNLAQAQNAAPRRVPQAYPDRPHAPQEVLDRGRAIYGVNCAFCHGSDAGGGETGPNLHRSQVVLNDKAGELILPIVHGERAEKGMPRIPITDEQVSDIAAWLHSYHVASRTDPDENHIDI